MLYPLKFKPIFKERIWGGNNLEANFNKKLKGNKHIGESWELSGVEGTLSVVSNGMFKGNSIEEMVEVYMGDLVGDRIYNEFGLEFPVLVKLIDACQALSIQVHPDDNLAMERYGTRGKSEMWYVVDADKDSEILVGFTKDISPEEYIESLNNHTLSDVMVHYKVKPGDVFYIPAGTVHSIGKGVLLAEIQQTSDVTYRLYDWDRRDEKGNQRELHTDLALDAINFRKSPGLKIDKAVAKDSFENLVKSDHFTVNAVNVDKQVDRELYDVDSFVIYLCVEGDVELNFEGSTEKLSKGETVLMPAIIDDISIKGKGKLLEVYIVK